MENVPSSAERPLDHDDDRRKRGIKRLAAHVMFECEMKEADERLITRDQALTRVRALYPLITGELTR